MKKIVVIFMSIIVLLVVIFLVGNDYKMNEKRVSIPTTDGTLSTVITSPKKGDIKGMILFVHGDGAQNATQDGGYEPLMERFAKQGYVSVSWDKLGVGQSSGDWLSQTMDDRAKEVLEVLEWMKIKYPSYTKKIGVWGASQAGWVIPKVLNKSSDIQFSLLAVPAINWVRQGAYYTRNQIKDAGGTAKEIAAVKKQFIDDSLLIEKNNSYAAYKKHGGEETMTSDRYLFVRNNLHSDVTNELSTMRAKTYLILAENDKNVDSVETEKVYRAKVNPENLEVKVIPHVGHQMLRTTIENSPALLNVFGLFIPKYFLVDKQYLDYCEEIVSKQ